MEQFRHDTRDQVFAWFRIKRHAHHFLSWRITSGVFLEQEEREKMVKRKKRKIANASLFIRTAYCTRLDCINVP